MTSNHENYMSRLSRVKHDQRGPLDHQSSSCANSSKIDYFDRLASDNRQKNATNAFSENWAQLRSQQPANKLSKSDPTYGIPTNEKTFLRGLKAHDQIHGEVDELCQIIRENGTRQTDGSIQITFKKLFLIYTAISNKMVGLLLRARKHGHVDFEGEILLQGRDDAKMIKLLEKKQPAN